MELGNMCFGNSRGEYPVDRDMQDEWYSYMQEMGFDSYGWHDLSDDSGAFQNDVFWIKPYFWGDCECGFDGRDYEWSRTNAHAETCYQSELKRAKVEAGGIVEGEFGWVASPEGINYEQWNAIEREIYNRLCAKHGLDPNFGCAAHCTCSHNDDYAAWREANSHADDCPIVLPNFWHKPSGFKLEWYKYPLRDSYSNQPLTRKLMRSMFADCIASMTAQETSGFAQDAKRLDPQGAGSVSEGNAP